MPPAPLTTEVLDVIYKFEMDSPKRTTILNEYNAGQRKLPSTAAAMQAYLVANMEIDIADAELDAMRTRVREH